MIIKLFIIGFGNVGQGLADLLIKKERLLKEQYGLHFTVVGIVTRRWGAIMDSNGLHLEQVLRSVRSGMGFEQSGYPVHFHSAEEIQEELEYDVLLELSVTDLKSGEPATSYIRQALTTGHHVITTNKGPIALHLLELKRMAKRNNVFLKYEGTVLAGTPLLNLIRNELAGLHVHKIEGIVNGSTNYILTLMEDGLDYEEALKKAKALGYLEADPTADVEGWDAVAKVMILAQAVFGQPIAIGEVERLGISHLRKDDIAKAGAQGKVWKLIARVEREGEGLKTSVQPQMIDRAHPLASVRGALNAVTIQTEYLKEVTIVGPGAGRHETGYAVLNDLISIFREQK